MKSNHNSFNHHETYENLHSHEKRGSCPYIVPTLFLFLEALACLLCLYIVNMGSDIQTWNKWIVSAVFIYFISVSVRRYLSVVERSKIRCLEKHHQTNKSDESEV